jgi:Predicted integral membrane protein
MLVIAGVLCASSLWSYDGIVQLNQNNIVAAHGMAPNGNHSPQGGMGIDSPHPNNNSRNRAPNNQGGNYTTQIAVYAGAFLLFSLAAYYLITSKKVSIHPSQGTFVILTVLGVGFLLRVCLATLIYGHPYDLSTFRNWATTAANNLSQFYQGRHSSDYPPLYIYVLYIIGKLGNLTAVSPYFTLLLKLPSIIADIATSFLLYKLAKRYLTLEISLLLSAFYAFNPAVFINSTIWGQVDSFFTLLIVSAVVLLTEKRIGLASVLFTSAVLMKPQGIIFLPVVFFELVRRKNLKSWLKVLVPGLITAIVLVFPFSWKGDWLWIFKLFASTLGEYPYATVNAFNFFSLLGKNYAQDASTLFVFSYHTWGLVFIVLITAIAWFLYLKGKSRVLAPAIALLLIDGVFTFSTRMHERYLFPALALSILSFIYLRDKRLLLLAAGLSSTIYMNTQYVLFETLNGVNSIPYGPFLIITSIINVLCFLYLIKVLYDQTLKEWRGWRKINVNNAEQNAA